MTSGWVAREGGVVRSFPAEEREVLSSLATGLDDTLALAGLIEGDAVLDRLFPRAYDAALGDAADEFAAHTRERMADGKRVRLARVMSDLDAATGERVVLDRDGAQAWLLTLNDMRLALAERIGPERVDDPLVGPVGDVYAWLGWLQAGLLDEIASVR